MVLTSSSINFVLFLYILCVSFLPLLPFVTLIVFFILLFSGKLKKNYMLIKLLFLLYLSLYSVYINLGAWVSLLSLNSVALEMSQMLVDLNLLFSSAVHSFLPLYFIKIIYNLMINCLFFIFSAMQWFLFCDKFFHNICTELRNHINGDLNVKCSFDFTAY